jgi:acyl carrier protein
MTRTDVLTSISIAISEVLHRELGDLTEDVRLFDDLNLDSTTVIELLMAIEDVLEITVDPDTLEPEHFTTVGALADYVISDLSPAA